MAICSEQPNQELERSQKEKWTATSIKPCFILYSLFVTEFVLLKKMQAIVRHRITIVSVRYALKQLHTYYNTIINQILSCNILHSNMRERKGNTVCLSWSTTFVTYLGMEPDMPGTPDNENRRHRNLEWH